MKNKVLKELLQVSQELKSMIRGDYKIHVCTCTLVDGASSNNSRLELCKHRDMSWSLLKCPNENDKYFF